MADIIGDESPTTYRHRRCGFPVGNGGLRRSYGLGGDDVYLLTDAFVLVGFDVVVEAAGGGTDTVIVQRDPTPGGLGLSYTLAANVENGIIGGVDTVPPDVQGTPPDAPFTLIGNVLDNSLTGNRADNTLDGGDGADTLNGGPGPDTLIGGTGDDIYLLLDVNFPVIVTNPSAVMIPVLTPSYDGVTEAADGGTDTVVVAPDGVERADVLHARRQCRERHYRRHRFRPGLDLAFSLSGNALDNSLTGNRADNTLNGNAGADTLNGGSGLDTLIGGAGDDTYLLLDVNFPVIIINPLTAAIIPALPPSYDGVTEAAGGGTDTVVVAPSRVPTHRSPTRSATTSRTASSPVSILAKRRICAFSLFGNGLDNSLTGNRAANTLNGGAGADTLNGGAGLDTLIGGAGDDTYLLLDVSSPVIVITPSAAIIPIFCQSTTRSPRRRTAAPTR